MAWAAAKVVWASGATWRYGISRNALHAEIQLLYWSSTVAHESTCRRVKLEAPCDAVPSLIQVIRVAAIQSAQVPSLVIYHPELRLRQRQITGTGCGFIHSETQRCVCARDDSRCGTLIVRMHEHVHRNRKEVLLHRIIEAAHQVVEAVKHEVAVLHGVVARAPALQ